MFSIPPATMIEASPQRIAWSASITAFKPEPQTLLMVNAAIVFGKPAASAACRAGACPTPAPITLPMMTSSTSTTETLAREMAASMATPPSAGAEMELRPPRKLPIGVRAPLIR